MKQKILLDTNFMLVPVQFKIDVYEELRDCFTLDACIMELKKLAKRNRDAKTALELAKQKRLKIVKTFEKNADAAILNYARTKRCAVVTNDKKLIKTLKKYGINVIRLRQKKYLVKE